MRKALFLSLACAIGGGGAVFDNWLPSEAENDGSGLLGVWKGLHTRAGKKKDRIEVLARGGVGGRGPTDLGAGDALNDTLRAAHACVLLKSNRKMQAATAGGSPPAPAVVVGDRVQVRDEFEPNGWEWGRVVSVGGGPLFVLKVAKDGWGDEAFEWFAWRQGPGNPERLSDPAAAAAKDKGKGKGKDKSRRQQREKGGGLPGLPSSGLAIVGCPLHEALTFANSLPEHTDVAVFLAPMVFHPLRPLPMLSRSMSVHGAKAAAETNGTLLELPALSNEEDEDEDDKADGEGGGGDSDGVEVGVDGETAARPPSSTPVPSPWASASLSSSTSSQRATPLEEAFPFHDASKDSSFNSRQQQGTPETQFVGPFFRLSSVLHGAWGGAEGGAGAAGGGSGGGGTEDLLSSARFEGDLADTTFTTADSQRLLSPPQQQSQQQHGDEDDEDDEAARHEESRSGGGGAGFAGKYGTPGRGGSDKGFIGPLLRVAPGVEVVLESVAFVGGRALLGGALYVGNEKDQRDLKDAKDGRRGFKPKEDKADGDEDQDDDDKEEMAHLKRHLLTQAGVKVKNCDFRRNGALFGGAVYIGSGLGTSIDDSAFVNNVAYNCGGALYVVEGSAGLRAAKSAFHRNRDQCNRHTTVNHFAAPKAGSYLPPGQDGGGGAGGRRRGGDVSDRQQQPEGNAEQQDASGALSQGQHLNLDDFFKYKQDEFLLPAPEDGEDAEGGGGGGKETQGNVKDEEEEEEEEAAERATEKEAAEEVDGEWRTAVDYLMNDHLHGVDAEMRKRELSSQRLRLLEFKALQPQEYERAVAQDAERQRSLQVLKLEELAQGARNAKKAREEKKAKDAKAKEARAAKKQKQQAKEEAMAAKRKKYKAGLLDDDDDDEEDEEEDDSEYEGEYHGLKL